MNKKHLHLKNENLNTHFNFNIYLISKSISYINT